MSNILYFSTQWCGPCKMFKPVVEEVAQQAGVAVQFIDAEQHRDLAAKYGISSVPAIVITVGGNAVNKLVGPQPKARLMEIFSNI